MFLAFSSISSFFKGCSQRVKTQSATNGFKNSSNFDRNLQVYSTHFIAVLCAPSVSPAEMKATSRTRPQASLHKNKAAGIYERQQEHKRIRSKIADEYRGINRWMEICYPNPVSSNDVLTWENLFGVGFEQHLPTAAMNNDDCYPSINQLTSGSVGA